MINPYALASSLTFDSIILGKQKSFSITSLIFLSSTFHVISFGIGYLLGQKLVTLIGHVDHWVSFIIFSILGVLNIKAFLKFENEHKARQANSLIKLSLIVGVLSVDAAIIGASSSNLISNPYVVVFNIILFSIFFIYLGRYIKSFIKRHNEKFLKLFEGILFCFIGFSILTSHLSGGF
jgi:putative Mn2+ efflux pump MntP